MKIVIIGAGISGCTIYLQLQKHLPRSPSGEEHSITIYEAYDTSIDATSEQRGNGATHSSSLVVGGGLGVAANGLNVLNRLDGDLLRDIVRSGYACGTMNMKSKGGSILVRMQPAGRPVLGGEAKDTMYTVACSRHGFWREIRRRVPDTAIVRKRISEVVARPDGRNIVRFLDESQPVEADLVIGADGLKSSAKRALFPDDKEDLYPPHYEGLCGVGGFIPYSNVKGHVDIGSMNFILGGNGFFGYYIAESAPDSPHRDSPYHISEPGEILRWWSTYAVDECPDPKTVDKDDILKQLHERHKHWSDPVIQSVLRDLDITSIYPTWIVPQLPTWERDGIVLVGDAAHALPPTSGQGCSQALEDVESFTLFLSHYLRKAYDDDKTDVMGQKEAIKKAARQYIKLRQPHVKEILDNARTNQDLKRDKSIVEEYAMYAMTWIFGWFPSIMTGPLKQVSQYNVAAEVEKVLGAEANSN